MPKTSGTVAAASLEVELEVELADGTSIRGSNVEEIARLVTIKTHDGDLGRPFTNSP